MNIYRNNQGYLVIEDLLGGEYKSMSYLYYTKQEAIKLNTLDWFCIYS